jgi:predicted dehydrogenase
MIRVALCGMGYWGRNLFRVFSNSRAFDLVAVVDANPEVRERLASQHPHLQLYDDVSELLKHSGIDAVAIATPVSFHYEIARQAIEAGLHVLVEKPMTASSAEADDLVARAALRGRTLMVDHTFLFHPAVRKLDELVKSGGLGHISYYDSQRINLGLFQPDVNVLWDLAPHDLSILDLLVGSEPVHVEATGYCHVNEGFPDIAYVTLHYPSSMVAHLNLSWMSPIKVRRIAVGGSEQMVVWDDMNREEPLKIYDSGISFRAKTERDMILPSYRIGSVHSPRLAGSEPLVDMVEHFGAVIRGEQSCVSDGAFGLRIVRTMERAQSALDLNLRRARAVTRAPSLKAIAGE